jgi:hypothetical protein
MYRMFMGIFAQIWITGCGDSCRDLVQAGDFELSQGNSTRALQLYNRAIKAGGCPDAVTKKEMATSLTRPSPVGK